MKYASEKKLLTNFLFASNYVWKTFRFGWSAVQSNQMLMSTTYENIGAYLSIKRFEF